MTGEAPRRPPAGQTTTRPTPGPSSTPPRRVVDPVARPGTGAPQPQPHPQPQPRPRPSASPAAGPTPPPKRPSAAPRPSRAGDTGPRDSDNPLQRMFYTIPPVWRDVFAAALIIMILMGGLWGYTGQPFPSQAPLVVVESGSMMHPEPTYGRFGTIDPGDLILVKDVDGIHDVVTMYGARGTGDHLGTGDREGYAAPGDVIIYRPFGRTHETPIIHRAVTWVEVEQSGGRTCYSYHNAQGDWMSCRPDVHLPELMLDHVSSFTASGWITRGDNPSTNKEADQVGIVQGRLIEPDWLIGKARGEIPWIGLLKFIVQGNDARVAQDPDGTPWCPVGNAIAPCDTFVMLWVTLGVLILIPVVVEAAAMFRRRRDDEDEDMDELDALAASPPPRDQTPPWERDAPYDDERRQ